MIVDFVVKKAPRFRVASIVRVGPWKEDNLRTEFGELLRWATARGLTTGRWIFLTRDHHRWEACLEYRGTAEPIGRIRLKILPARSVASVVFDPERISSRVIYHALSDWTRKRRLDGDLGSVASVREVYRGDPWKEPQAWARCEVQFVLRS
ncbi:MAG: GyrI-like domain-containing protein [Thermoplasmata archaeon]|nr:GyrI-like domain-containing protein [Thermoplasmata archaeon]